MAGATTKESLGTEEERLGLMLAAASQPKSLPGVLDLREKRVRKAAFLRARGASWDEVAVVLGRRGKRRADSAQHYCTRVRAFWAKLMREATDDLLADEVEPEALATNRQLMKLKDSEDVKEKDVAVRAADCILRYLASLRRKEIVVGALLPETDELLIERLRASVNAAAAREAARQDFIGPEGDLERGDAEDSGL